MLTYFRFDFSRLYGDLQAGNGQPIFRAARFLLAGSEYFFR